ncbi:MAG: hypothetical protein Q4D04_10560, partial [Clostridia bacterium]|nr:hypothetical protein [Clostridia bacterium]
MQSDFAQGFVNAMLGWMRSLAAAVSNMFASSPQTQSSGAAMLGWFADNWVWLLIALVALGIAMDWIVWLLRWRPYWLWFKKRRMVVDDGIDEAEIYEPVQRFKSRALRYDEDYDELNDRYYGYDDIDAQRYDLDDEDAGDYDFDDGEYGGGADGDNEYDDGEDDVYDGEYDDDGVDDGDEYG